jgi:formamidopyrimidine-DNA glycosylase
MPELPEVENVRRSLSELVVGKTVCGVHTNWEKILVGALQCRQGEQVSQGAVLVRFAEDHTAQEERS